MYVIAPLLRALHWLPVAYRIVFKILMLTFKTIHNLAPLTFRNLYLWKTLGVGTILDQMTANFLTFHYGGRGGGGAQITKKKLN